MEVKKKRSALEMQCFQGLRVSESTLGNIGGEFSCDRKSERMGMNRTSTMGDGSGRVLMGQDLGKELN